LSGCPILTDSLVKKLDMHNSKFIRRRRR
jgi:hypothetical protein